MKCTFVASSTYSYPSISSDSLPGSISSKDSAAGGRSSAPTSREPSVLLLFSPETLGHRGTCQPVATPISYLQRSKHFSKGRQEAKTFLQTHPRPQKGLGLMYCRRPRSNSCCQGRAALSILFPTSKRVLPPTRLLSPRLRKQRVAIACVIHRGISLTFWRPVSYSWTPAKGWEQRGSTGRNIHVPLESLFSLLSPDLARPQRGRQTQCLLAAGKSLTHFLQLQTRGQSPFNIAHMAQSIFTPMQRLLLNKKQSR